MFDIAITNASLVPGSTGSGYGTPPLSDPNSLSPHGVFPTYFEIYEFEFDGAIVDIKDVQPGQTGTGKGYIETFEIDIISLSEGVSGLHFDLYTLDSEDQVEAFAPYSHDAETVPEPANMFLLGTGLVFLAGLGRRKFKK